MQIRNLCKFEPAGQTAYCIGFLAMIQLPEIIYIGVLPIFMFLDLTELCFKPTKI